MTALLPHAAPGGPGATDLHTVTSALSDTADAIGLPDDVRTLLAGSYREMSAQVPVRMNARSKPWFDDFQMIGAAARRAASSPV